MKEKPSNIYDIQVHPDYHGKRLDLFLKEMIPKHSRSFLQGLINDGKVKVNGKDSKPNYRIKKGQSIQTIIPAPQEIIIEPEDIGLDIVYEDGNMAVINKPQGMVMHPAPGHYSRTLVNALLHRYDTLSNIGGKMRPGILHRIDKDTSGLVVIAKTNFAHANLSTQIQEQTAQRTYWAIVENDVTDNEGTIRAPIKRHPTKRKRMTVAIDEEEGRNATTHFNVLERFEGFTLVEARLETGRTHQIRVHMAYINHPIVGDPVYGPRKQKFNLKGQALHSVKLGLDHPTTGEFMEFTAPPPKKFLELLDILRRMS